jgi:magnesium chelatase family protein
VLVKTFCAAVNGLEVTPVTIEVSLTPGILYHFTGLGDTAVREGRDRINAAFQHLGYRFPHGDITVNMAPADLRKEGSSFDLPLAIALLAADGSIVCNELERYMLVGELSLDGTLQPIRGALPIAIRARKEQFKGLIVPAQNVREAAVVNNLDVYGLESLTDVIDFLSGRRQFEPTRIDTRREFYEQQAHSDLDFADVRGQEAAKRALEVAAAGGHNLIMIGSPGSGKSMMAKRLPSILPPLSLAESLETTQIHSIAGKLSRNATLIAQRPFRAPHHTISEVALVGGGNNPQPGEISLAHNGVLFLDELPEFQRTVLESLRQPLEDGFVTVSRAAATATYPARFLLVAAMNPCPCGNRGSRTKPCTCTTAQIKRYAGRISGPLLDRIDLHIEMTEVGYREITERRPAEPSETVRARVTAARAIQRERFKNDGIRTNAEMNGPLIRRYCNPAGESEKLLRDAFRRLQLSARAYQRVLKVARTVADLENSPEIRPEHYAEAIQYRSMSMLSDL